MKTLPLFSRPALIFTFVTVLAALPTLRAGEETPPPERREKLREGGERMADELGLTDEQRAKMKPLFAQERAEIDAVRADTSLAKEARRAKAGEIHRKYREQRDAILTPEQKAKADKMRENFGKHRAEPAEKPADK